MENREKIIKVFLDDLPKKGSLINWKLSVGYKVPFIYCDIKGEIEIINCEYEENKKNKRICYLTIKYKNKTMKLINSKFSKCQIGKLLGKRTINFKAEIGQIIKDDKRDMVIIDRKYIKDKRGQNWKHYRYKCNICGFECGEHYKIGEFKEELWIEENNLLHHKKGCSCCYNRVSVPDINSIVVNKETQWMIPYFQGGYDEAKKYSKGSNDKLYFKCPDCGRIKDKSMTINNLYEKHSIGCDCGDGIKYPEKFMMELLKNLDVVYCFQYNPEWIKPRKYDFYIPSMNLIIEMDGGWHKYDNLLSGQTKEESKDIDDYKDEMARKHGMDIIRIDCCYGDANRFEYVKLSTLNKLHDIFNLSNVDWFRCEEFALSNLCKKACDLKRNNPEMSTKDIGNIVGVQYGTIIKYLKQGSKIWDGINYDPKEEMIKNANHANKSLYKAVEIFKDGEKLGRFENMILLERNSKTLFGVELKRQSMSRVCKGETKEYKGFVFKFAS